MNPNDHEFSHDLTNDETPFNQMTEAHIQDAFRDLSRRAGVVPVDNGPHVRAGAGGRAGRGDWFANLLGGGAGGGGFGGDKRLIPALAFTVLAALAGFGVWQLLPGDDSRSSDIATEGDLDNDGTTNGESDGDGSVATDDGTSDGTGTTTDDDATDDDSDAAPAPGEQGARYRVDTAKVAADAGDPFLNVRLAADADAELVAKLPPNYRGLIATGESTRTDDGATWVEVQLKDPVAVDLGEPLHGGLPIGWVNVAFLIPLDDGIAVGTDEVPACTGSGQAVGGGGLSSTAYVYGLESGYVGGGTDCLRVVVTVAPGSNPFAWEEVPGGTGPATAVPGSFVSSSGGMGVGLELGDNIASVWPGATETDDGVYIARSTDGTVDLVSPAPVSRVGLTPIAEAGIVVIDLTIAGDAPTSGRFVALTDEPLVGAGTVTVTGLARPFEANLGVSIIDDSGQPVAALYSGSASLGTLRGTEYAVQTNDWTEAWGRFAVTASDLQPGSYTMRLDGEGGVESPTRTAVPFTVTDGPDSSTAEPGADDQAIAQALVRFAQGGSLADVNLADEVTLGLGVDHQETVTAAELEDRDNWLLDVDDFEGFAGPFNLLDQLADGQVSFTTGSIPHCAAPPRDWPTEWDALTQVNIEPVGATSCIEWYGVSLFRNNSGEVEVIVLDLFGP